MELKVSRTCVEIEDEGSDNCGFRWNSDDKLVMCFRMGKNKTKQYKTTTTTNLEKTEKS